MKGCYFIIEPHSKLKQRYITRLIPRRIPETAMAAAATAPTPVISVLDDAKIQRISTKKLKLALAISCAAALLGIAAFIVFLSGSPRHLASGAVMRINVNDRGQTRLVFTRAKTASEVFALLGIKPDNDDYINVSPDTPVTPDMTLEYHSVEINNYTIDKTLSHHTITEEIGTIPRGERKVLRAGSDGYLYREVHAEYRDGKLYSETIKNERHIPPVDKLVQVGVGGTITGQDGTVYNYSHYMDVSATAYVAKGITYTGKKAASGIVAVDPSVIPLGSTLYVKGDYGDFGVCTADDIGGGIKGGRIDICMDGPLEKLLEFGVRTMRVYFLEQ